MIAPLTGAHRSASDPDVDLRSIPISEADIGRLREMIVNRKVSYQPFIFRDDLEVGEGLAFETATSDIWPPRKGVVYWPGHPDSLADLAVSENDRDAFRAANGRLRQWYEDKLTLMAGLVDTVSGHEFLELGCNTGYFIHRLSQLGARRSIGVDYGHFGDVFEWFNRVIGSRSEFSHAAWDSTRHRIADTELPEVDVAISISVTCHIADPMHMLAYLCHKARKAVCFFVPLSGKDDVSLSFNHPPNYFQDHLRWPSSFDSKVLPSARLVELGLEQCGFGAIERPGDNLFVARRTGPGKSIYSGGDETLTVPCLLRSVGAYNIVKHGTTYFGLPQNLGPIDVRNERTRSLEGVITGSSEMEIERTLQSLGLA
jgi:hypothetical protein